MDKERAINIAVTCVLSSGLDNEEKAEIIEVLRNVDDGDDRSLD